MKIRPVGVELFPEDRGRRRKGQTYMTKLTAVFHKFANRPKMYPVQC
jgi:hypothetical protein